MSRVPLRGDARAPHRDVRIQAADDRARAIKKRRRFCEMARCNQVTREGKPFCADHLSESDYVAGLLSDPRRSSGAHAATD